MVVCVNIQYSLLNSCVVWKLSMRLLKLISTFLIVLITSCGGGNVISANANLTVINTPLISPGTTTYIVIKNISQTRGIANPAIVLAPWLATLAKESNLTYSGTLGVNESYTFSFYLNNNLSTIESTRSNYQYILTNDISNVLQITSASLINPLTPTLDVTVAPSPLYLPLTEDVLINADLWSDKPEILSAGYGFEGIQGVAQGESYVIAAGGAWEQVATPNPPYRALTSAATPQAIETSFGYPTYFADAMPIVFSWPVLPSTVNREDFQVLLNNGNISIPFVASIYPNEEFNERSVVVIFGNFGNRLAPGTPGAIYPVSVSVVSGLKLVGPAGTVSAVGLTHSSSNPYLPNSGPSLVGAKLSIMSTAGEGVGSNNAFSSGYPNDGVSYYGSNNAQYRLRIYTTGGFSPDGVAAVLPGDFKKFFKLQVTQPDGTISWITDSGLNYSFPQGNIQVVGLADLDVAGESINDAYVEDFDNYIDIILAGDIAAMRMITAVQIPAADGYLPFYNPGGPGNNPTPGVIYTTAGPAQLQPVTQAIDDPKTVNYPN